MDGDMVVGIMVAVAALAAMGGLVWWSRWSINRIADRKLESAREIIRDLRNVS